MVDIHKLIDDIAGLEQSLQQRLFLAPCVGGGQVRTRIAGMIYTFTPKPRNREGWGLFRAIDHTTAEWVEEAELPQIDAYLRLLKPFRLHLTFRLQRQTWLGYPVNETDANQRLAYCRPVPVHLVNQGAALEPIIARWDGAAFWFEDSDRRADPQLTDDLRQSLNTGTPLEQLRRKGLTPELKTGYALALGGTTGYRQPKPKQISSDRQRLSQALDMAGGRLKSYRDHDDFWLVEWVTQDGEQHSSAIAKQDLTVVSAGICLDGYDRRFDLQSLVGIVEQRPDWV